MRVGSTALLVVLTSLAESSATIPPPRLLVKWKDGPRSPAAASGNATLGARVIRNFDALGWQLVELPTVVTVTRALDSYRALEAVIGVEEDRALRMEPPPLIRSEPVTRGSSPSLAGQPLPVAPNDPLFNQQWFLNKIGAANAWQVTTGSADVVVAVLDTGVDYNHPDLAANMWVNPGETGLDASGRDKATNGVDDDGNGYVDDVHGIDAETGSGDPMDRGYFSPGQTPVYHGTACAGIIGAVGNNGTGVAGVNWNVRIMAVRWYGDLSQPYFPTVVSHALAAWDYVIQMKRRGVNIRVASNSEFSNDWTDARRDAIAAAGREGVLTVAIAGNVAADQDATPISYPGDYDEPSVLCVAASTQTDTLADFSGYGLSTVDLAAPGVNIVILTKGGGTLSGGWGTSFACPQVAGAAALLLAQHPLLGLDELKAAILGSVDHPAALKDKVVTGGRLNLDRAMQYVTNPDQPAIVIYASPAGWRARPDAPITVTFNRPMDRSSVERALVIEPAVAGTFEWLEGDRSFRFQHAEPFDTRTNYTVRLLATALDTAGGSLDGNFNQVRDGTPADDYLWTFRFPIANDDFLHAQPLSGESGSTSGTLLYSSQEPAEVQFAGSSELGGTVWYRWSAPEAPGWYTFDLTGGTSFDTLLSVNTGDQLDQLVEVAGNDNDGAKSSSRTSFDTRPGQSYAIVVAGKATSIEDLVNPAKSGKFTLAWYPTPAPGFTGTVFSPARAIPGNRVSLTGTNFTGATAVLFNGASASFTNAAANNLDLRITATVPPDASSGPITVVTPHGSATSGASFQVLPPPLAIVRTDAANVELRWAAMSDTITLEAADELSPESWHRVPDNPTRADGQSVLRVLASGQRFYRLTAK